MNTKTWKIVQRVVLEAVNKRKLKTKTIEYVPQEIREAYLLYKTSWSMKRDENCISTNNESCEKTCVGVCKANQKINSN